MELLGNATAYNITTNDTEYDFTTLLPFYTYRITVAAVTDPGVGPGSLAVDVVLPESGKLLHISTITGLPLSWVSAHSPYAKFEGINEN